ncbi:unnamed protein product, partial [Brassica napus]
MRETFVDQFYRKSDKNLIHSFHTHTHPHLNFLMPFGTLYDPYSEGADFVRGYPCSFRSGVPCAAS